MAFTWSTASTVNGARKSQQLSWNDLPADSTIDIQLGALVPGQHAIRRVSADPFAESSAVFGPREPEIANLTRDRQRASTLRHRRRQEWRRYGL